MGYLSFHRRRRGEALVFCPYLWPELFGHEAHQELTKKLITKTIPVLPEVRAVFQKGTLVIAWGSTNSMVAEEILGEAFVHKTNFASGVISEGEPNASHSVSNCMTK